METKQDLFNEWCKLAVAEVYNKDLAIFDWEDAMFKVYAKATTFALLHKLDLPYVITDNYEIPSSPLRLISTNTIRHTGKPLQVRHLS